MAGAVSRFEWLKPFECLRRFWVSMPAAFDGFYASLFNFVEGFAVLWLAPFLGLNG